MCACVCVTETELFPLSTSNSHELPSYFDTGLYFSRLTASHLPRSAVTDVVSTDVVAETDVKYAALESSPSVIALLNDKLESQSKVTTEFSILRITFCHVDCIDSCFVSFSLGY